jgi:transcriptional regulator GlxA family with amidase domain
MRIAIHVFEGAEELDWAGPWEVLAYWAAGREDIDVVTVADRPGPVRCAKGLRVLPDMTWDDLGAVDVLIYPGGIGTRSHLGVQAIRDRVRSLHEAGTLLMSVCTGSLVFADTGLLDGRPATTHWRSMDLLRDLGTDIELRPDDRFVDDGELITAAGVSAGIDAALHLVARLGSVEEARAVRRGIQYDPAPPV